MTPLLVIHGFVVSSMAITLICTEASMSLLLSNSSMHCNSVHVLNVYAAIVYVRHNHGQLMHETAPAANRTWG
jgi:uncharacterized membrane protein YGL010W